MVAHHFELLLNSSSAQQRMWRVVQMGVFVLVDSNSSRCHSVAAAPPDSICSQFSHEVVADIVYRTPVSNRDLHRIWWCWSTVTAEESGRDLSEASSWL
jgi:hypothetical protein